MPRPFSPATAEQVVAAVEAISLNPTSRTAEFVAAFAELTKDQAERALLLAVDLSLLTQDAQTYAPSSPLCRFIVAGKQLQSAAVLRIVLDSYEPFTFFLNRLIVTGDASSAARETMCFFQLDAHREQIKETLINLGTYSQSLMTRGAGRYSPDREFEPYALEVLAKACADAAAATGRIREQIGATAAQIVSAQDVIAPLADALVRAKGADGRGAVVAAGNGIESFLEALADRMGVSVSGATGINAKLDRLSQAGKIPKKLIHMGKYLGHVRNAADHGVDPEVNASWTIRSSTGTEYTFVACSFVAAAIAAERSDPPII